MHPDDTSSLEHTFQGPPASRGWVCQLYYQEVQGGSGHFRGPIREMQRTFPPEPHPTTGESLLALLERTTGPQLEQILAWMREDGVLEQLLPELEHCFGVEQNEHHAYDVGTHIVKATAAADPRPARLRLALLLHDIGKPDTRSQGEDGRIHFYEHHTVGAEKVEEIGPRLGLAPERTRWLRDAVAYHMELMWVKEPHQDRTRLRKLARQLLDSPLELEELVQIRVADKKGAGRPQKALSQAWKDQMQTILEEWAKQPPVLRTDQLAVNRQQLAAYMNLPADHAEVENTHQQMLEKVIEDPMKNDPETLLAPVRPRLPVDGHDVIRELDLDGGGPKVGEILERLRSEQLEAGFTANRKQLLERIRELGQRRQPSSRKPSR